MNKQEALKTGKLYRTQLENAVNKLGLTLGDMCGVEYQTWKLSVHNDDELEMILSCFSFEESYVDIDWEDSWTGRGFVIHFTSKIPMPFTLA